MKTMTFDQLADWLDRGDDLLLIDVLPREQFARDRIPGSRNIPVEESGFVNSVSTAAGGDCDKPIVVYCAGESCDASTRAAGELEGAGFTNVYDFKGGLEAWHEAEQKESQRSTGSRPLSTRSSADDSARSEAASDSSDSRRATSERRERRASHDATAREPMS
jgi:rhodanese-related sulfurtransferase